MIKEKYLNYFLKRKEKKNALIEFHIVFLKDN
jgi:hypothetical protein